MERLTSRWSRFVVREPFAHTLLIGSDGVEAVELGMHRASFSGTDALAMDVQKRAERWIATSAPDYPLVLGEGQRLANLAFFGAARNAGRRVRVVALSAPAGTLELRRRGRTQSASWLRGAATRADNLIRLARQEGYVVHSIDASASLEVVTARVREVMPDVFVAAGASDPSPDAA